MEHACEICGLPEKSRYNPGRMVQYLCSSCVARLSLISQEQLKEARTIAEQKGYTNKVWGVNHFIKREEQEHGTMAKRLNNEGHNHGGRTHRISRHQQINVR